jgi:hypothetical protein
MAVGDPLSVAEEARRGLQAAVYVYQKLSEPWIVAQLARFHAAADHAALMRGMAQLRASSLLIGTGGLVTTLVVPLAVWVGVWVALGAGLAEAKALVKKDKFQSGFSRGFVMRLLGWHWDHVLSRFFSPRPASVNPFDESISEEGNDAYNEGLRAGYVHASFLEKEDRDGILARLKSLSPYSSKGRWTRNDQISYVSELAGAGRRYNVFQTGD